MTVALPRSAAGVSEREAPGDPDARALAASHANAHRAGRFTRGPRRALRRLERDLVDVTRGLAGRAAPATRARAAEWLLDNAHLVEGALLRVREGLPSGFHRLLPRLPDGEVRVRAVARHLVYQGEGYVDPGGLVPFLSAYQAVTPLGIGELWAFSSMLRWVLLERLVSSGGALLTDGEGDGPGGGEDRSPARGHGQTDATTTVEIAACIRSLRELDALDWKRLFEAVSLVDRSLRLDPARVYARSDFETRDRCRKVVESLARGSGLDEVEVAELAREAAARETRREAPERHVGFWLIGPGRDRLKAIAGYRPDPWTFLTERSRRLAGPMYFSGLVLVTGGVLAVLCLPLVGREDAAPTLVGALLGVVPASAVALALVNRLAISVVRPRVLPKLEIGRRVPAGCETLVVVPVLLSSEGTVDDDLAQLELNYQGNSLDGLAFVLLADFPDAEREAEPGDQALLQRVEDGVSRLNARYRKGAEGGPFLLLHRGRSWNPGEGVWMGWERKRGKLAQLNDMILKGEGDLEVRVGSVERIRGRRYVITLDADTFLPQGAAARLIGTAAHPLNRPKLDARGRVRAGYTVLQPRVETTPGSAASTRFATLFEGERGLDLYSRAVSDVYQDLFGAGIFAGKGIYDVEAFERTLRGRVPEDAVLSHDLFEGEHGRAGFVSDVAVYEDFPSHPLTFLRRLHRWVRGDWQIAGWLLPSVRSADGTRIRNAIGALGRWKIADNLRRSLLMPSLALLLVAGWTWLPGPAWWWTAAGTGVPAVPLFLGVVERARTRMRAVDRSILLTAAPAPPGMSVVRWIVVLALLPYRAVLEVDAVARTLVRVLVSRRHLLQWTTAAHVARRYGSEGAPSPWRVMWVVPTLALGLAAVVTFIRPEALPACAPLVLLWVVSPGLVRTLGRTRTRASRPLTEAEVRRLRALARRTWGFFERFLGPEHQWLPPDHFQERPATGAAYRSSPTNVGLGVLSVLAAWDLGYVTLSSVGATLDNVMDAMEALPRYRGHFFNWYDTWHGTVLPPRFISTVDSGNLAAALMTLARGCRTLPDEAFPRPAEEARGLRDALAVVEESARRLEARSPVGLRLEPFRRMIREIDREIREGHGSARAWAGTIVALDRGALPELETAAVELVELGTRTGRVGAGAELRTTLQHLRKQNERLIDTLRASTPWLLPDDPGGTWAPLAPRLPDRVTLRSLPRLLDEVLAERGGDQPPGAGAELRRVRDHARALRAQLEDVAERAESLLEDMSFGFLYDRQRRIFHVGYEVEADRPTPSHYDLLASEARLASFVAIARGEVPHEHWLHLGRPFGRAGGQGVLLSWSGTLFEFLMPELLLRTPESSLLDFADRAAVDRQIAFGRKRKVPWGVSESSYHHLDHHGTYQYRAFGVPDLALRRDQDPRVVVAPYASLLAMRIRPREVVHNLRRIVELDGLGLYGCYEALDFSGGGGGRTRPSVVRSWMAHHQAMALLSLANFFTDSRMVERFHDDPRVRAAELLLHERVPGRVPDRPAALRSPSLERGEAPPPLQAWKPRPDASLPQVHALSNGRWTTVLTDRGSSGTLYRGRDVTRWRSDPTCTCSGVWLYLQDLDDGTLWSAAAAPTYVLPGVDEVVFAPHRADFRRTVGDITSRLTVFVVPTVPVEVRRLRLTNQGSTPRRLGVTSYGEVVLASHAQDRRHPAFVKLFVESHFQADAATLLFRRRPGARGVEPMHAAHTVLTGAGATLVGWETDRGRFLGRAGVDADPAGLATGPRGLSRTVGTTLDPIYGLGCEVELPPYGQCTLSFLTSAGPSEAHALSAMESLRSPERVDWALEQVAERARLALHATGMDPGNAHLVQELLTALLLPYHNLRGRAIRHRVAPQRQPELWRHGVSGDVPIVLLRVAEGDHLGRAEDVLRAHGRLFRSRIESDLVVIDETAGGYTDPVRNWLQGAVLRYHGGGWLGRTGGVHHVAGAALGEVERDALEAAASVFIDTARGDLERQLAGLLEAPARLPPLLSVVGAPHAPESTPPLPETGELLFDNGRGGLTPDGREYVVRVDGGGGEHTPAPWVNVVANPDFGFTVSERGAGFTWAGNSGEHRLTPWSNDPVRDRPGEALYLRDEETAEVWSPTPAPAPSSAPYEARHGAGYTTFLHHSHGLAQHLQLFVPRDAPVKIVRLRVSNLRRRPRRITVTSFIEWVLGNHRDTTAPHVVTELAAQDSAILARETFSGAGASRLAFHAASAPLHGATADRLEFLAGPEALRLPPALERVGLAEAFGAARDPCSALQLHLDIPPGEERTVHFLLGEGATREEALACIRRFRDPAAVEEAWSEVRSWWEEFLGRVQVRTPEPALDVLLNRWLPYQALACRLHARSALYQSSGAFGFRDQLQDVLSFLFREPGLARERILDAAAHQFEEGDVLHWWHPETGAGVRTRCSDDLLWLPRVTAEYVAATGDVSVLDEPVAFLRAPPLEDGERERYESFPPGPASAGLYEHCLRALRRGATRGRHGLPLMGTGDWNDGMDRVGEEGRGESVWLAWFLLGTLRAFRPLAEARADDGTLRFLDEEDTRLREAVEAHGWDGDWYRRGYFDDGTPLGTASADECRIDSLTQSWAVLSGGARPDRARRALDAVLRELVREEERLILLLAPPFDRTDREPGYIKAYPPGIRENGGQYTHAAIWAAWAFTLLGDGAEAGRLLRLLNPLLRTNTAEGVASYRVEPYVVAADVYGGGEHAGRGGWTWYTGSAGWLYRLGVEAVLGLRPSGGGFRVEPCIPPEWKGFEATLRRDGSEYTVRVENPGGGTSKVEEVRLDGHPVAADALFMEPGTHHVVVRLAAAGEGETGPRNAGPPGSDRGRATTTDRTDPHP